MAGYKEKKTMSVKIFIECDICKKEILTFVNFYDYLLEMESKAK